MIRTGAIRPNGEGLWRVERSARTVYAIVVFTLGGMHVLYDGIIWKRPVPGTGGMLRYDPQRGLMVVTQATRPSSLHVDRPSFGRGLSAAVAVRIGLGVVTAYGQEWLSDTTASLANSAGPRSLAAFLVARFHRRPLPAAAAVLTLACRELGDASGAA